MLKEMDQRYAKTLLEHGGRDGLIADHTGVLTEEEQEIPLK